MRNRTWITIVALLTLCTSAKAQMKWNATYQQYIDQYKDLAISQMQKYGIPASITLAQGVFESGGGQSELARRGNNHFGIKCHGWKGATIHHDDDATAECFRAYPTPYDSFEDHSRFLRNGKRYRNLFSLARTDYKGWARGLKAAGYATNPQYADRLIALIQLYKLYRLDTQTKYDKELAERFTKDKPARPGGQLHRIYMYNKNYYLKARRGDTFESIGREVEISPKKLAKYNELDVSDKLSEGDIIYLKKKQKRATEDYKDRLHYVRKGDSMWSIAQFYGIRLKSLYKLNGLRPEYQARVGDALRLR